MRRPKNGWVLINTERALIATWNLPGLPAQVTELQEEPRKLAHQLDAWLKPPRES